MPPPDQAALAVFVQGFTDATGLVVTSKPFCFGDSPQLADELAALVRSGRKRATATTIVEFEDEGEPLPTIGQHSVVYDGAGQPVCVIRTEHLSVGPLDEVLDPAFAWDEGEGDRTYEDWLAQHSAYWLRVLPNVGAEFTPNLGVVLERFSVVWPQRDEAEVLAAREDAYVRPVWIEDRDWLADTMRERWDGVVISRGEVLEPARLPALVAVDRGGLRLGALTFRPRPGSSDSVETEVVTVDALESGRGVGSLLLDAAATLARRAGWRRLWLVTTNDNTAALRFYQRTGLDLVAFHRNALAPSRALKPSIPQMGLDSIPIRHELELELPLPPTLRDR
jgi:uncharacterized protein YhfF/GNAT superfamily N-acetyltransferase